MKNINIIIIHGKVDVDRDKKRLRNNKRDNIPKAKLNFEQ